MEQARITRITTMKEEANRYKLSRVEIDDETKRLLGEFANREGVPLSKALHALIAQYRKVGK